MGSQASISANSKPNEKENLNHEVCNGSTAPANNTLHRKITELEQKVKEYQDLQSRNQELEKRLSILEKSMEKLQSPVARGESEREGSSLQGFDSDTCHLSVQRNPDTESLMSNLSDVSPEVTLASSVDQPSSATTVTTEQRRKKRRPRREFSIAPMNDIEAYGKGLNPNQLSSPSPKLKPWKPKLAASESNPLSVTMDESMLTGEERIGGSRGGRGKLTKAASIDIMPLSQRKQSQQANNTVNNHDNNGSISQDNNVSNNNNNSYIRTDNLERGKHRTVRIC